MLVREFLSKLNKMKEQVIGRSEICSTQREQQALRFVQDLMYESSCKKDTG